METRIEPSSQAACKNKTGWYPGVHRVSCYYQCHWNSHLRSTVRLAWAPDTWASKDGPAGVSRSLASGPDCARRGFTLMLPRARLADYHSQARSRPLPIFVNKGVFLLVTDWTSFIEKNILSHSSTEPPFLTCLFTYHDYTVFIITRV